LQIVLKQLLPAVVEAAVKKVDQLGARAAVSIGEQIPAGGLFKNYDLHGDQKERRFYFLSHSSWG
jgi:hypothetical protein